MCLAIPMRVEEVRPDGTGVADLDGVRYDVDLSLVPGVAVGQHVIVHAGFAIERLNEDEARATLALFDELARAAGSGDDKTAGIV